MFHRQASSCRTTLVSPRTRHLCFLVARASYTYKSLRSPHLGLPLTAGSAAIARPHDVGILGRGGAGLYILRYIQLIKIYQGDGVFEERLILTSGNSTSGTTGTDL